MSTDIGGIFKLNKEETKAFIHEMLHPDNESHKKMKAFLEKYRTGDDNTMFTIDEDLKSKLKNEDITNIIISTEEEVNG